MKIQNLRDLYEHCIADLYSAEKQLADALPKLAASATHPDLKDAFSKHLTETEEHAVRLEEIMDRSLMEKPSDMCMGIKGIIDEGSSLLGKLTDANITDAGSIVAGQKAEHYEIATYGSAIEFAKILHLDDDVKLLAMTLKEEKAADAKLTALAEGGWITPGIDEMATEEEM
jgi:ferritin-like metal-binding protein YciE